MFDTMLYVHALRVTLRVFDDTTNALHATHVIDAIDDDNVTLRRIDDATTSTIDVATFCDAFVIDAHAYMCNATQYTIDA